MTTIKFTAEHCPTCRKLSAALDSIGYKATTEIEINESNINVARQYNISSFPTILVLDDNNEEVKRIVGLHPLSRYKEILDKI